MDLVFLAEFTVARPSWGLLFWTFLIFMLFWGIIGKFAFRPIKDALKKRESDIQSALDEARSAREEMTRLSTDNQRLLNEAREERAKMLRESKEAGDKLINEAKQKAKLEAQKIVADARQEIDNQKQKAILEVKNQLGQISVDIAEKLVRHELAKTAEQNNLVDKLVDDVHLS